jgi:hypothetical protein
LIFVTRAFFAIAFITGTISSGSHEMFESPDSGK